MKRKNGFTLIELIAVITILAIIALIAVPKVTEVIEDSEKKTLKNSASNLIKTVDMYLIQTKKDYGKVDVLDGDLVYNGEKPEYGVVEINKKGESRMYAYKDGYCITKTYDGEIKVEESTKEDCSGFVDALCKANTEKVSALVWGGSDYPLSSDSYNSEEVGLLASESGKYTPGVTYTCNLGDGDRTFYVLEESGDNVSLILGTNLGNTVEWGPSHDDDMNELGNVLGPVYALKHLQEQTTNWNNLEESQISLPTKDQIYKAAGNKTSGLPIWLYSYTNTNVSFGYWTATPDDSDFLGAWHITYSGSIGNHQIDFTSIDVGIRPVITILKSELK